MRQNTTAGQADPRVVGGHQGVRAVPPGVLITVAAALSATVLLGADLVLGQDTVPLPVRDRQGRFTISVPPTWRVHQSGGDMPALSALSPSPPETPPDSVEVYLRDMSVSLSPEACVQEAAMAMRMIIGYWTTLSEGPDTLGGLPAYSRAYTWRTRTGAERRSILTCVSVGRRVFVIVGTVMNSADGAAQDLPEVIRIMDTFRPGPAAPDPQIRDAGGH